MKAVGRPPQIDKNGEHIVRTTINVSVPVKLLEFLKREKIPRSELFNKVVTKMHEGQICPQCYTTDIVSNHIGTRCNSACSRYQPYFYVRNSCPKCKKEFGPGTVPILTSKKIIYKGINQTGTEDLVICEACNVNSK